MISLYSRIFLPMVGCSDRFAPLLYCHQAYTLRCSVKSYISANTSITVDTFLAAIQRGEDVVPHGSGWNQTSLRLESNMFWIEISLLDAAFSNVCGFYPKHVRG